MEQEPNLHVYLTAIGLIRYNSHLTRKQLELLLVSDSEKYAQMFYPTEPRTSTSMSRREKHIRDIFLAYNLCYNHLLSLYVRPTSVK